jgi:hypothetical protein
MYIYFEKLNYVITCEEIPQVISVEEMESKSLQNMCNKWEKHDNPDGTFKLSFKYDPNTNIEIDDINLDDSSDSSHSSEGFDEGDDLYLQNSGFQDLVWVYLTDTFCDICEIEGYPNIYKWIYPNDYVLHIKDGELTDCSVSNIQDIQDSCYIIFTEYIRAPTEVILK